MSGITFEQKMRLGGQAAIAMVGEFSMGIDPVSKALEKIATRLTDLGIPYAVVGGMAMAGHGYVRATTDVDLLVTAESLVRIHERLVGLGYVPPFTGSKQLRDTELGIRIEFLVTGGFPGDGKPKPVAFPDPVDSSTQIDGRSYLRLDKLIELKLASGMTNSGRLKDLADVQEMIKVFTLKEDFSSQLNPYVREKYLELWQGIRENPDVHNDPNR